MISFSIIMSIRIMHRSCRAESRQDPDAAEDQPASGSDVAGGFAPPLASLGATMRAFPPTMKPVLVKCPASWSTVLTRAMVAAVVLIAGLHANEAQTRECNEPWAELLCLRKAALASAPSQGKRHAKHQENDSEIF